MTEDEAKTKMCCNGLTRACVGSACMAWRWLPAKPLDVPPGGFNLRAYDPVKMLEFVIAPPNEPQPTEGYCGLAGKP